MEGNRYKLHMFGLPPVEDLQTLADYVHLSKGLLYKLSKSNSMFYKRFNLPKKMGGTRTILCPSKKMKAVQAWILENILNHIHVADAAKGFLKKTNTLDNAWPHKDNRYFLCLDIDDFFPSISYAKVYTVFNTLGYNPHVSHIFTSLCTCNGILPQGAVTSPALSNIVCIRLDYRISSYTGKHNVTYTRYADDMTFSSMSPGRLIGTKRVVSQILEDEGFHLNEQKTRFMGPRRQRKVVGLIVGDDTLGVGRKRKRILRATIHRLVTADLTDAERDKLVRHIKGWLSYMNSIDSQGLKQIETYYQHLLRRYKMSDSTMVSLFK